MTLENVKLRSLAIEYIETDTLVPNPDNARKHPASQIRKLAQGFEEYGFLAPIIIDGDGMILAGHGRYEAALTIDLSPVPVVRVEHLSAKQLRAFMLFDNKIASLSSFDMPKLSAELSYLLKGGDAFSIQATGFDIVEVDRILGHAADAKAEEAIALPPDDAPVVSRPGDLWIIGEKHRLLCGNCLDRTIVERLFGAEKAAAVVTDPPYNVVILGNVSSTHGNWQMACGEMSDSEFTYSFLRPIFKLISQFTLPGAFMFCFMDWKHLRHVQNAADGVLAEQKNLITWAKPEASESADKTRQGQRPCYEQARRILRGRHSAHPSVSPEVLHCRRWNLREQQLLTSRITASYFAARSTSGDSRRQASAQDVNTLIGRAIGRPHRPKNCTSPRSNPAS